MPLTSPPTPVQKLSGPAMAANGKPLDLGTSAEASRLERRRRAQNSRVDRNWRKP